MRRTTFSILFYTKRSKQLRNGEAPIYCRVSIDGKRAEFAVKRTVLPENWNDKKGCVRGGSKAKEINHYLEHVRYMLYQKQKNLEDRGRVVTSKNLVLAYHGNFESEKFLIEVFKEHNENINKLLGKGYSPLTLIRYKTSVKHLQTFISEKFGLTDIPINEVNTKFIRDYEVYLKGIRECNTNTTTKYLKNLKKIITIGLNNNWIQVNPFNGIKFQNVDGERVYLEKKELESIEEKEFKIERIAQVKDIFLFCCYTGLAFVDVKGLKPGDITFGNDGRKWINKKRQKTQVKYMVPLIDKAVSIMEKYTHNPYCLINGVVLPVISNQRMNAYLKEISDLCGINKTLTTHCARHTFATTVTLANGVSMEAVSKMLGHSSLDMTKHYARITEGLISSEMEKIQALQN